MNAITICQPYAELIVRGEKLIENRTWPTSHRGPLAIHAGKSRAWLDAGDLQRYPGMPFGAIVAIATLADCMHVSRLRPPYDTHQHANGPYCWILAHVHPVSPVPINGAQGLWRVPDAVVAQFSPLEPRL